MVTGISSIFNGPGSATEGVYLFNVPGDAGLVTIECHGEAKGNAGGYASGTFSGLAGNALIVKIGGGGAGAASNGSRFTRPAESGRGGHYAGVFTATTSATYTAASQTTYPTQSYGWYTRSGGVESNAYSGIRQLVIRWEGATVYDGSGVGSGGVTVGNYTYYPSTYRNSLYGWSSDYNNAFDVYRVDNVSVSQATALVIAGGSGSGNFADVQQGGIGGGPFGFGGNSSSGSGGGPSPSRGGGSGGTQSAGGAGGPGYEGAGGTGSALQGGSGYTSDAGRSSGGAGGGGYFGGGGGGSGYDSGNYASGAGGGGGSGYVKPTATSPQNNAGGSSYPQGRVAISF